MQPREIARAHYSAIAAVRAAVVESYGVWDDVLSLTVLRSPGIKKCMEMHYNVWASEPDNPENGVLAEYFITAHDSKDDRKWRRRVMRRYSVAMHVRFGSMGLKTFWAYGMIDKVVLDSVKAVLEARKEARRNLLESRVASEHLAPEEAAAAERRMDEDQHRRTQQARRARHSAKSAQNYALRREAAAQLGGACHWCTKQSQPHRTRCLVCMHLVCDRCTYQDSEGTWYLLCRSCETRRGSGNLEEAGRVARYPKPSRCSKAHGPSDPDHYGNLVECEECCRWICVACARDDGPPQVCRQCPERMRRQGQLKGPSLVNPCRNTGQGKGDVQGKGKRQQGKGEKGGKGGKRKGPLTMGVAMAMTDYARELTEQGGGVVVVVVVGVGEGVGSGSGLVVGRGTEAAAKQSSAQR